MYVFGRSLTCDFDRAPVASRQHAALIHHANGNLYAVDLSSHRTLSTASRSSRMRRRDPRRRRPHLRRVDAHVHAARRERRRRRRRRREQQPRRGGEQQRPRRREVPLAATAAAIGGGADADGGGGGGEGGAGKKKKKSKQYWDEHKKERKRQLSYGKKQMTENERVSMSAGAGTGCMGPASTKCWLLDAVARRGPIAADAVPPGPSPGASVPAAPPSRCASPSPLRTRRQNGGGGAQCRRRRAHGSVAAGVERVRVRHHALAKEEPEQDPGREVLSEEEEEEEEPFRPPRRASPPARPRGRSTKFRPLRT